EELLNQLFEQKVYIMESQRVVREHTRKYCLRGSSSSSGFTIGGTPTCSSSPQFPEEHTVHGTFSQQQGVASASKPSGMYNIEECYFPRVASASQPYASMNIDLGEDVPAGMNLDIGLSLDATFDMVLDTPHNE
ncbi:hypothetical protein MKX03_032554, partial [Papaver bracteatum]